jgi:hypothetical protein
MNHGRFWSGRRRTSRLTYVVFLSASIADIACTSDGEILEPPPPEPRVRVEAAVDEAPEEAPEIDVIMRTRSRSDGDPAQTTQAGRVDPDAFVEASRRAASADPGSLERGRAEAEMASALGGGGQLSENERRDVAMAWQEYARTRTRR